MTYSNLALGGSDEPNFAPAEPLRDKVETNPPRPKGLDDWARGQRETFRRYYQATWDRKVLTAQKQELYYRGYQRLKQADYGNYWRILDENPLAYVLNVYRFWSDLITSKWVASNPKYDIESGKPHDSRIRAGADYADTVIDHYERKFYTQTENIRQSKRAQFEGNLFWHFYYDPNAKAKAQKPIVQQGQVRMGKDMANCPDCGYSGGLEEFVQSPEMPPEMPPEMAAQAPPGAAPEPGMACPNCGSPNAQPQIAPITPVQNVTGYEEFETGDICWRGVQIYNLRFDPTVTLEESSWLLWEEYFDRDVLAEVYPSLRLPAESSFPVGIDTGLTVKNTLEMSGTYRYGNSIEAPNRTLFTRIWMEPCKYLKQTIPEDMETSDGQIIPAGTKVIDFCPDGCYLAMVGDMVVDIRNEVKNDHWIQMMYHQPATGGLGDGTDDMTEPQRQRNVSKSQMNLWLRSSATPGGLFNPLLIDGENYTGDPDNLVPIKSENLGMLQGIAGITDAVYYPQPAPMSPELVQYIQGLDNDLQLAAHTTDYSGGLPGVNNSTATGAQIGQSLSASIHTLQLAQYADFRRKAATIILKLFKKYCPEERAFQIASPMGQVESKFFGGLDIDDDLIIDIVADSWLPRTAQEKAERMNQALLAIGGIQGLGMLKQGMPEMVGELSDIYQVDFGDQTYSEARTVTRDRIDQLMKNLPSVQQMAAMIPPFAPQPVMDPATGQPTGEQQMMPTDPTAILSQQLVGTIQPPITPMELGHLDSIEEYRSWMLQDEGRQADPILRAAAQGCIQGHVQGLMMEAQLRAMLAGAAMPPQSAEGGGDQTSGGPPSSNRPKDQKKPAKTSEQHRQNSARGAQQTSRPGQKGQ